MKFKGVIFDLDGVITDTAEYHYLAWKYLADKIDIKIDIEFNESLKGISRNESLERILAKGNKENVYTDKEKDELTKIKNEYYLKLLERVTPNDIMENILETLNYLKENDIKIALASASKNATFILEKLQLKNYFEVIVDPASVKHGKPSPDIFLEGARLVELSPKECIGVEDSKAGVTAINNSNMLSIGIGDCDKLSHADIVIPDTFYLQTTIYNILKK